MAVSGIPPAVYVQVIIRCITAKAGYGMGSFGSPCFLSNEQKFFLFLQNFPGFPLETRKQMGYNTGVYAQRGPFRIVTKAHERI